MSTNSSPTTGGENLDTFANMTPIEPVQPDVSQPTDMNNQVNNSGVDTFDNTEVILPDSMKEGTKEDGNSGEEQEQTEKTEETEKPEVKRETDNLDDQDSDDEGTETEESESEGEDSLGEEGESDTEETPPTELEGKTIRLKVGDEAVDINENATVPVKVRGRKEFVTLNELRENFSGKKVWGEEIEKAKGRQAELEAEAETFNQQKEGVKEHFTKIGEMLQEAFENPEADPLAAMKYLVELSGRNVLDFEKRIMEHSVGLAHQFADMDETEQNLYWTQREIQILRDNQATQAKLAEERTATEQRNQNLGKIREQYGVSQEQYEAANEELLDLGYSENQISPEQVSHYAALKPLVTQAEELAEPMKEDLSSDEYEQLVTLSADFSYKNGMEMADAMKMVAKTKLGFEITTEDDLVEELQEKVKKPVNKVAGKGSARRAVETPDDHIETFDDFDSLNYGR